VTSEDVRKLLDYAEAEPPTVRKGLPGSVYVEIRADGPSHTPLTLWVGSYDKDIQMSHAAALILRDFLNEHFPAGGAE